MTDPVAGIVNSATAQEIRKSIVDGSYKFCNHLECTRMIQGTLPRREEVEKTHIGEFMARPDRRVDTVKELVYAFDKSCNLSCPSCRNELINEKASTSIEKLRAVEEKLPQLLPTLRAIQINASGELFSSKSSRRVLELIDDERCPNLRLDIISNGTLFNEQEWNKFPGIHNKIRSVRISTDAACKITFEELRRGAKYESFLENVGFLSGLRVKGVIPVLMFSFTYQLGNFREMREFLDFCDDMKADFAIFERLLNIAFSDRDYRQKAVHLSGHPQHEEFLAVIRDPIFRAWCVWHDFDYPGVENLAAEEAKRRFEWSKDPQPEKRPDLANRSEVQAHAGVSDAVPDFR
jgi:MoaA/NifB/PqqE/SkfB family radical SAM enzyme